MESGGSFGYIRLLIAADDNETLVHVEGDTKVNRGVILKNGMYNGINTAIRMILGVLIIPVLIRAIGLDEYGLWTLISSVVGLVELAEIGLSVSTTYFVSRDLSALEEGGMTQTLTVTLSVVLVMASLAAGGLWLGSNKIVTLLSNLNPSQQGTAAQALRIGAFIVWADLVRRVFIGVEQAYQRYDVMNLLVSGQSIVSNLGLLAMAMLGGTTLTLVRWQAVLSVTMLIAHILVVRWLLRGISLRFAWNWQRVREIVRYSVFTWLTSLSSALFSKADRLIIGVSLGTESLAVYGAITTVTSKINHLSAVPVQPLMPAISTLTSHQQRDHQTLEGHLQQALRINAAIALGLSALLFIFAPWVVTILLSGAALPEYVLAFRLAVIICGVYSLNAVGYYLLLGINAVPLLMGIQMVSALLSLLLIGIAARSFGIIGAVVGNMGYLGTLGLIFLGMRRLSIQNSSWLNWISFPLLWWGVSIAGAIMLPFQTFFWGVMLWGGVAVLALLGWFIKAEQALFVTLWRSVRFRQRQRPSGQV